MRMDREQNSDGPIVSAFSLGGFKVDDGVYRALLLFGGHVLRGFTAAMMLGIVVGTYSSIYVSSSLLISLGLSPQVGDKKKRVGPPEALGRGERIS